MCVGGTANLPVPLFRFKEKELVFNDWPADVEQRIISVNWSLFNQWIDLFD